MDKKYYIIVDGNQQGPFTPEELREHGLTADSRVYALGWTEFRDAKDIPELGEYITSRQPEGSKREETPSESSTEGVSTSSQSEKDLLMKILFHLDDLQRENRELKKEMEKIRSGEKVAEVPENSKITPPPIENVAVVEENNPVVTETDRQWEKEWDKERNQDISDKNNNKTANGCMIAFIIILVLFAIGSILYLVSHRNSGYEDAAIEVAEPMVDVAVDSEMTEVPTEEGAVEYYEGPAPEAPAEAASFDYTYDEEY